MIGNSGEDQSWNEMALEPEKKLNPKQLIVEHSRSFALTLRALPEDKRDFVGLTYLVARLADTMADSGNWPMQTRITYLEKWENAVCKGNYQNWFIDASVGSFYKKESQLLMSAKQLAELYCQSEESDLIVGRELLEILFGAMKWAVRTFAEASEDEPIYGIADPNTFDWYCYGHAGCVGRFWQKVFSLPQNLEPLAINYGKALERINILRDVVDDRKKGWILLPKSDLDAAGFQSNRPWEEADRWPQFCQQYIRETRSHLLNGAQFCDSIPYQSFRLRWASMMPLKIGEASLQLYEKELQKLETSKIDRKQVKQLAMQSVFDVALNRKLSKRILKKGRA